MNGVFLCFKLKVGPNKRRLLSDKSSTFHYLSAVLLLSGVSQISEAKFTAIKTSFSLNSFLFYHSLQTKTGLDISRTENVAAILLQFPFSASKRCRTLTFCRVWTDRNYGCIHFAPHPDTNNIWGFLVLLQTLALEATRNKLVLSPNIMFKTKTQN